MRQTRARSWRWHLFLCSLLVFSAICLAQRDRSSQTSNSQPRASSSSSRNETPGLRVNVRLVNVFTTVTDSQGAPVANLARDDFRVLEDGVSQTISVFGRESELPLSIALAIDTSGSTRRDMPLEITSAKKFVRSILRPVDRL